MSTRSWLRNLFARPAHTIRKAPHGARLAVEALEDRWCPSAFTVTNTNDSGPGSLRDAITQAQSGANAGVADTIVFNNNPSLGTNFYDGTQHIIPVSTGELDLTDTAATTIIGPGANLLSISGNSTSRVFDIKSGDAAAISGLTVTGGAGGLTNSGTLTLTDCTVSGNSAGQRGANANGGGLRNEGTATLTNCTVSGNAGLNGGGVYNGGTATLTNCTVSGNKTDGNGSGGGLLNFEYAAITLTNCTVSGNSVTVNGGEFSDAIAAGGGLLNIDGTATLTNCTVSGNIVTANGGYAGSGIATGGGVYNIGRTATLTNCTVSGNSVTGNAGNGNYYGGSGFAFGGGMTNNGGTVTLINCTVSGNSATGNAGSGVYPGVGISSGGGLRNFGTLTLGNSIVSANTATTPDIAGSISNDLGHNLLGAALAGTTSGPGDIFTDTPHLGLLADNGAPLVGAPGSQVVLQTMALLPGSPAINAGNNLLAVDAQGNPLTTDERGLPRFVGTVDIGAYEVQTIVLRATASSQGTINIGSNGSIVLHLAIASGQLSGTNTVASLFNGATFTIGIQNADGSVTYGTLPATATVGSDGTITVTMQMDNALKADLYDAYVNGHAVNFNITAISNDGNYALDTDTLSRLLNNGAFKYVP